LRSEAAALGRITRHDFDRKTSDGGAMMKCITHTRIRVNRTGACWLIRRFLDPEAEFLFVPTEQVAESQAASGDAGFDAHGAT